MYILPGTENSYLEVRPDTITLHRVERSWPKQSETEIRVTFEIDNLFDVVFIKPTIFRRGWITFIFDDPGVSTQTMGVKYGNRNRVESLYMILQRRLFT